MSKNSDTLIAFIAGAVTGAILGVLYAPDKGKNTRDKLSFQLEKYKDKLSEMLGELITEHEHADTAAKAESEKVVNEAKGKADKLIHDVELLIDQIRNAKHV
ncbi:MAG: YtxH domain-containing protein [Cytophagaceae bacterium]|nr:YtxH domain-containing protein [Cytophagaceae bacterium]